MFQGLTSIIAWAQSKKNHFEKVTLAHKLIVLAARTLKLRTILILEEDFLLTPSNGPTVHNLQALTQFIKEGEWDLLRLGYIARNFNTSGIFTSKKQCTHSCSCAMDGDENVCTTLHRCDIRSSVAYMVRETIFDHFLATRGTIDGRDGVLQSFKQFYTVPPLFHQEAKLRDGMELDNNFKELCVHKPKNKPSLKELLDAQRQSDEIA